MNIKMHKTKGKIAGLGFRGQYGQQKWSDARWEQYHNHQHLCQSVAKIMIIRVIRAIRGKNNCVPFAVLALWQD